jgi:hypothetical protein
MPFGYCSVTIKGIFKILEASIRIFAFDITFSILSIAEQIFPEYLPAQMQFPPFLQFPGFPYLSYYCCFIKLFSVSLGRITKNTAQNSLFLSSQVAAVAIAYRA